MTSWNVSMSPNLASWLVLTIRVKPLTARIGVSTACGQQSHEQVDWLPCQAAYLIRPRRVWFFGRGGMSSTSRNQDGRYDDDIIDSISRARPQITRRHRDLF